MMGPGGERWLGELVRASFWLALAWCWQRTSKSRAPHDLQEVIRALDRLALLLLLGHTGTEPELDELSNLVLGKEDEP